MTLRSSVCYSVTGWLGLLCLLSGCRPQLPPDEDAVLYYFRNARTHGPVRRIWPQGQTYVNNVLKADANLQKALSKLRRFQAIGSLWLKDDPRWRSEEQRLQTTNELKQLLNLDEPERQRLLGTLKEEVERVPEGLDLATPEAKAAFAGRAWAALAHEGVPLEQQISGPAGTVGMHLRLFEAVNAAADGLVPDESGLKFSDAEQQARIDQLYDGLEQHLYGLREELVQHAENTLLEIAGTLKTVDKRAQRNEYEYLHGRHKYLRDELEALQKQLYGTLDAAEGQLQDLEDQAADAAPSQRAKLDAQLASQRARVKHLKADRQSLDARIKAILDSVKAIESAD